MGCVLITGASGHIGRALARALAPDRPVLCLSRRDPELGLPWLAGDFTEPETLARLEDRGVEALCHLGAVTGGCSEEDGLRVNVQGTARLLRRLSDGGCRRFVLASSIAAVGLADPNFRPLSLPMADDHPCLAADAYGLSKHLMEDVASYLCRRQPDIAVTSLRLASIADDARLPEPRRPGARGAWALAGITVMATSDAVRALRLALAAPTRPGHLILNATAPRAWVATPLPEVLTAWYGEGLDTSAYTRPGHAYDSVFDVHRIREELGFTAERLPAGAAGA